MPYENAFPPDNNDSITKYLQAMMSRQPTVMPSSGGGPQRPATPPSMLNGPPRSGPWSNTGDAAYKAALLATTAYGNGALKAAGNSDWMKELISFFGGGGGGSAATGVDPTEIMSMFA